MTELFGGVARDVGNLAQQSVRSTKMHCTGDHPSSMCRQLPKLTKKPQIATGSLRQLPVRSAPQDPRARLRDDKDIKQVLQNKCLRSRTENLDQQIIISYPLESMFKITRFLIKTKSSGYQNKLNRDQVFCGPTRVNAATVDI